MCVSTRGQLLDSWLAKCDGLHQQHMTAAAAKHQDAISALTQSAAAAAAESVARQEQLSSEVQQLQVQIAALRSTHEALQTQFAQITEQAQQRSDTVCITRLCACMTVVLTYLRCAFSCAVESAPARLSSVH